MIEMMLKYDGGLADQNTLNFYDAAQALVGFQRSLALTTHLVLNGEIITQAPSLKGAKIITQAPAEGSWKVVVGIVAPIFAVASVGKDSPMGQIVTSVYDYVLYSSMGFHVDYSKTLQQQYAEHIHQKKIDEAKLNSLIEKPESSIANMHRPIVGSKSAKVASVYGAPVRHEPTSKLGPDMNAITYDHLMDTIYLDSEESLSGKVSSYNMNTYKGRLFVDQESRTIPFELVDTAKIPDQISRVIRSIRLNAAGKGDDLAQVEFDAYKVVSRNGRLRNLHITAVRDFH